MVVWSECISSQPTASDNPHLNVIFSVCLNMPFNIMQVRNMKCLVLY